MKTRWSLMAALMVVLTLGLFAFGVATGTPSNDASGYSPPVDATVNRVDSRDAMAVEPALCRSDHDKMCVVNYAADATMKAVERDKSMAGESQHLITSHLTYLEKEVWRCRAVPWRTT